MTNRKETLVSPEVGALLVKQLAHELKNHNLYKSFAAFFGREGIVDLEEYFNKSAAEEYNHHNWVFHYLSESDYKFNYPAIEANTEQASEYVLPFEQALAREIQTTQMLYAIYRQCVSEDDFMTASWLYEKLIKEQIEEENKSRMALDIINADADIFVKADKILDLLE